jgi:hypothetical protein
MLFSEAHGGHFTYDPGLRALCPTRWSIRADSLASVQIDFEVVQKSLDEFTRMSTHHMEKSAKVNGISSQLQKFDLLFGMMLGEKALRYVDNLSCTLQHKELSAAEGQLAAELTVDTLATHRKEEEFENLCASIMDKAACVEVNKPNVECLSYWKLVTVQAILQQLQKSITGEYILRRLI